MSSLHTQGLNNVQLADYNPENGTTAKDAGSVNDSFNSSDDVALSEREPNSLNQTTVEQSEKCCDGGCRVWCKKYFWEGQNLNNVRPTINKLENGKIEPIQKINVAAAKELPWHQKILLHHRRLLAMTIPAIFVNFFWLAVMIHYDFWGYFKDKYFLTITMLFASFVAGMTSLGGATIAFPVMTLAFQIDPAVARDFGVMIQSFGMGCASFTITFMKVKTEHRVLVLASIGGLAGIIFGFHFVDPHMSPAQKKIVFASILFSFAFVLLVLNCQRNRKTFNEIPDFTLWKGLVLIITGFVGGIMTSFAGGGIDLSCFSLMTLFFRVSEKVATPSSVILMAGNSVVGFFWRWAIMEGVTSETWQFLAVCVPIVIIGAPFGAVIGSHFHRLVLGTIIIFIDIITLIAALSIIPLTPTLIGISIGVMAGGVIVFSLLAYGGSRIINNIQIARNVIPPAATNAESESSHL